MDKTDKNNMRQVILDFPLQFHKALQLSKNIKPKGEFDNLVVCGMGGSSLPADLLKTYLALDLPIYISRNYKLPKKSNAKSLIFTISFSGNTEETLSCYAQALSRGFEPISITIGGKLAELCQQNNTALILLPNEGIQPRCGTGYIFTAMLKVLINAGIVEDKIADIDETVELLKNNSSFEEKAKNLAKKLKNKLILVYASEGYEALARIWKIKFNENAKVLAFYNTFPELNHNEMAGFTNLSKENIPLIVLMLKNKKNHPRIIKRMQITADIIKQKGGEIIFINMPQGNPLYEIFATLYIGDWLSYYLALEYETDPSPVEVVEELKWRMRDE